MEQSNRIAWSLYYSNCQLPVDLFNNECLIVNNAISTNIKVVYQNLFVSVC